MTGPLKLKLTAKDIDFFLSQAQRLWIETSAVSCLPGTDRPLEPRQFTAVAHLQAALDLFCRLKLMNEFQIRLDIGSSEPDTEGL